MLVLMGAAAVAIGIGPASAHSTPSGRLVRVNLRPGVIGLFRRASISVTGLTARSVAVRLRGATDEAGLAYEWTPYRWRRLSPAHGSWGGFLPSPALLGVYQLQLRLDDGHDVVGARRLLRVFRPGTLTRRSFRTPKATVRDYVARLPGHQVVVALRRFPQAAFDHRDARLNRIFAVAYAPRGDSRISSRLGLFATTVRDGFRGRWRVLEATVSPYD